MYTKTYIVTINCKDCTPSKISCMQYDQVGMYMMTIFSDRNKGYKLVKNRAFCRLLITVPLKMYSKFGQPVGRMLKLVRKWPMANCY